MSFLETLSVVIANQKVVSIRNKKSQGIVGLVVIANQKVVSIRNLHHAHVGFFKVIANQKVVSIRNGRPCSEVLT